MRFLTDILVFTRWPVVTGLLCAIIFLQVKQNNLTTLPNTPRQANHNLNAIPYNQLGIASLASAVQKAAPSVVNVYTRKASKLSDHPFYSDPFFKRFFNSTEASQAPKFDLGSGVIMTKDGYIVTNNHVIDEADEIVVILQDGREAKARIAGINQNSDLAVLKINLKNIQPIVLADQSTHQVGGIVLAIGNPFGVGQTVTQGIISATRRYGLNISRFENFIQTDAAINPGNSGGALINSQGELVGIATANLAQSGYTGGIGFAIPADTALQTVNDIIKHGKVIRGWLGIDVEGLSVQQGDNQQRLAGFLITGINQDSPAKKANLQLGDIITRINDKTGNALLRGEQEIAETRPGESIEIEILRDKTQMVVTVTLEAFPS